jgi:hypothetical protein
VLTISLLIGSCIGVLWGYTINTIGDPNLQIISGTNPNITCIKPTKVLYKCLAKYKDSPNS